MQLYQGRRVFNLKVWITVQTLTAVSEFKLFCHCLYTDLGTDTHWTFVSFCSSGTLSRRHLYTACRHKDKAGVSTCCVSNPYRLITTCHTLTSRKKTRQWCASATRVTICPVRTSSPFSYKCRHELDRKWNTSAQCKNEQKNYCSYYRPFIHATGN